MKDEMMIPCDQVIARLWEYLDDELEPEHSERVRAHLDACSHCYPQYDFERTYLLFLQRTANQNVPPGVRRRVFKRILEEDGRRAPRGLLGVLRRLVRGS